MKIVLILAVTLVIFSSGCLEDYDVAEVAPAEYLDQEHHHEHDETCTECDEGHGESVDGIQQAGSSTPSGHNHAAGIRNHGTQWFFNQPWAAPFIWGKLARDGGIFLGLACLIFFLTGRKRR